MKLFILGLIVLLILVCQIYKIIKEKEPIDKDKEKKIMETYTMDKNGDNNIDVNEYNAFLKKRIEFNEDNVNYYDDLLYNNKKSKELKATHDYNTWIFLNANGALEEETIDPDIEGFEVDGVRDGYKGEIDKCRAITSCDMLDKPGYENCGYCGNIGPKKGGGGGANYNQPGKFDYRPKVTGGKIIGPDVCPTDSLEPNLRKGEYQLKEIGNRWAKTTYDCKKIQAQDKCNTIKNCSELADDSEDGLGSVCGWCPADKAYPIDINRQLRYDINNEPENTEVKGDTCKALNEVYSPPDCNSDDCMVPYFTELLKGTQCSSCDNEGGGEIVNNRYRHTDTCLTDLWTTPMIEGDKKINVTCSTNYDGGINGETGEEGGLWVKNYGDKDIIQEGGTRVYRNFGQMPYYRVQNDMNNQVMYQIYKFKSDYNSIVNGIPKWKYGDELIEVPYIKKSSRRRWKMNPDFNSKLNDNTEFSSSYYNDEKDIDTLWKQCFNLENKDNDLKCVPIDEIKEMEGDLNEKSSDPYMTKDEYYNKVATACSDLTGDYKCSSKLKFDGDKLVLDEENGTVKCKIQNL